MTESAQTFSLFYIFGHVGLVGKIVIGLLTFSSVWCWAIIFSKLRSFKKAKTQDEAFLDFFWKGSNLEDVFNHAEKFQASPIALVFRGGYKELRKFSQSNSSRNEVLETIERALGKSSQAQMDVLERNTSWLATTASAAPFVGLFGTVWGIMNSFQSIGLSGNANLAVVAPGISEALITTAIGIGAAVPAVVGYNFILSKLKKVGSDIDYFCADFLSLIQRNLKS